MNILEKAIGAFLILIFLLAIYALVFTIPKKWEEARIEQSQKITDCVNRGNEVSWCLEVI